MYIVTLVIHTKSCLLILKWKGLMTWRIDFACLSRLDVCFVVIDNYLIQRFGFSSLVLHHVHARISTPQTNSARIKGEQVFSSPSSKFYRNLRNLSSSLEFLQVEWTWPYCWTTAAANFNAQRKKSSPWRLFRSSKATQRRNPNPFAFEENVLRFSWPLIASFMKWTEKRSQTFLFSIQRKATWIVFRFKDQKPLH